MRDLLGLSTRIVGVVSAHAPAYALSFAEGRVVKTNDARTFADGMACRVPDAEALRIVREGAERVLLVNDDEVAQAMRVLFEDTHNVAEGAGAAALAALTQDRDNGRLPAGARRCDTDRRQCRQPYFRGGARWQDTAGLNFLQHSCGWRACWSCCLPERVLRPNRCATMSSVDGHSLAVWSKLPARPRAVMLLVHGRTWSSRPDFDLQAPGEELSLMDGLVAMDIAAYAVDLRGYGATPRDASGWLTPDARLSM